MSRFLLSLLVLQLFSPTVTGFICPKYLKCECHAGDDGDYKLHCPTKAGAVFDLTIKPDERVRIQCDNSPDWTDFLQGMMLDIGSVREVVFSFCAPPGFQDAGMILAQLGLTNIKFLKYEDLEAKLTADRLAVFSHIEYLSLQFSDKQLGSVDSDLLKGFSNLTDLRISSAGIQIPRGLFDTTSSLEYLELSRNNLKDLPLGIFDHLKNIRLLNLWNNDLRKLDRQVFRNLSSLKYLDFHGNSLTSLPVDVFRDLKNLEHVSMGQNNFTSLPQGIFENNPKLTKVKIMYHKVNLTTLPPTMLANFEDLDTVMLVRSGLRSLPEDLLWGSKKLAKLDLNRNYLKSLPARLLKDAGKLQTFSAHFNDLQELPEGVFSNAKELAELDLSKNHLTRIDRYTFDGLVSLEELNMEHNDLRSIHIDAFTSLINLKIAKFSSNKLTLKSSLFDIFGPVSPFHPCNSLQQLYLAHNNINQMFSDWVISKTQLTLLDLSHNEFELLETEDLQFVSSNLMKVDLRNNFIHEIDLAHLEYISRNQSDDTNTASSHKRMGRILLDSNPIECDCQIFSLLRYLNGELNRNAQDFVNLEVDELTCEGPDYMEGLKVSDLKASELKCLVQSAMPKPNDPCSEDSDCDCWLRPADKTLMIDCAERNLTSVPTWIDTKGVNCVEMDLSMNGLKSAPTMAEHGYENVCSLNLAGNQISAVDESLITPNLKILNLDRNYLTTLAPALLNKLSNNSQISRLTLEGNPWKCDCNSRNLLSFVQSNFSHIPGLLSIKCHNTNVTLSKLSYEDLCPSYTRILIIAVSVIFCLLVTIIAIVVSFQRQIKIWMYSKNLCMCFFNEEELDRDKIYDAFISYSHKDEDFVVKELVPRLEEGPKPFKLCIHIRDWLVGEWIPTQIVRSVEESRRTIVVLSPNFIESVWSKLEFQTAHKQALNDRRARVIVVLYEDIGPVENLDHELRAYLQMNTYVKWGDPWFWQKLRYAMPHRSNARFNNNNNRDTVFTISKAIADRIVYVNEIETKKSDKEEVLPDPEKPDDIKWTFVESLDTEKCKLETVDSSSCSIYV